MSTRWFIHRNGKSLGPHTAEEIREALRDGTFDPFDLVSREGSPMRRELVEVDELFVNSKIVYGDGQGSGVGGGGDPTSVGRSGNAGHLLGSSGGAGGGHVPQLGNLPALVALGTDAAGKSSDMLAGQGHLALAHDGRETQHAQPAMLGEQKDKRRRRRDPKHFHLMDKSGRVLGPLNAGEIQSLFYKGVLDRAVRVMRDGSSAKVPVARFIALYSDGKQRSAPQQGAHPSLGAMTPSALQRMQAARRSVAPPLAKVSSVAVLAVVAALLLCAATGWIIHSHRGRWSARPGDADQAPTRLEHRSRPPKHPKGDRSLGPALPTDRAPPADTGDASPTPPSRPARVASATPRSGRPPDRRRPADDAKRRQAELDRKQAEQRRTHLADLSRLHDQQSVKRKSAAKAASLAVTPAAPPTASTPVEPPAKPAKSAKPAKPPKPAPTPAVKVAAAPKGPTVASLTDGQQVQGFGPLSFDKGALAACQGPCNLTFSGGGGSLQVAFFKAVWGPALAQKSGGVYVSGSVRKSGASVKLVLSNVR